MLLENKTRERERERDRIRLEDLWRFQEDCKVMEHMEVDIRLPPYIPGLY
jgi:hypothetical protein